MSDENHLAILKQGVETWDAWRKEHGDVTPGLGGSKLSGVMLSGANLSGANFSGANFSGVDLRNADLSDAKLSDVTGLLADKLAGANLSNSSGSDQHLSS